MCRIRGIMGTTSFERFHWTSFRDDRAAQEAGARTRALRGNQGARGRTYVLVLDSLHVDAARTAIVRKQVSDFIAEHTSANDIVAVVQIGNPRENQPFTTQRDLVLRSVNNFIGQKSQPPAASTAMDSLLRPQTTQVEDRESGSRAHNARLALATLTQICNRMSGLGAQRRAIVLFSEGIDTDLSDLIGEDRRPARTRQGNRRPGGRPLAASVGGVRRRVQR